MFTLADRVQETCAAPGTGIVTLLGAVTEYQSFSAGIGANNTTYYTIADQTGSNWEVGLGTIGATGLTLTRTTILASSNAGSVVNFSVGIQNIWCDYPAGKAVYADASGNVGIGTSSPSSKLTVGANPPASGAIAGVCAATGVSLALSDNTNNSLYVSHPSGSAATFGTDGGGQIAFSTNGRASERMRIDSSGNVKLSTAGTAIQNSSGRPILNQTGSILQVVNVLYGTAVNSTSSTFASTGLTASITPSSTSSKILVIVNMASIQNNNSGNGVNFQLWRNSTGIFTFATVNGYTNSAIVTVTSGGGTTYTDAPATTSATSYTVYFASNSGAGQQVTTQANNATSTITLMEIAG